MREKLRKEFNDKIWHGQQDESRSGAGSTLEFTERLRAQLPAFLAKHEVKTFLDAPCGDWNWMASVDLGDVHYIGGDIADAVVEEVRKKHGAANREFQLLDITSDPLPKVDMMMARDVLFHLKFWLRWAFLENFVASETPLLLTTMHHIKTNKKLGKNGGFTKFNPMAAPFNFPEPIDMIHETADDLPADIAETEEGRKHRSLGLWTRDQIAEVLKAREAAKAAASAVAVLALALPLALTGTPGLADSQAIAPGATLTPAQIGHAFLGGCAPTVPAMMEDRAELFQTAFGWETIDLGTDAGYISPEGAITVSIDGNPLSATCEMSIVADLAGDGTELLASLESHLADAVDTPPTPETLDEGLRWSWDGSNSSFTLEYLAVEGAYLLRLTSES